jgi:hypothetical protein
MLQIAADVTGDTVRHGSTRRARDEEAWQPPKSWAPSDRLLRARRHA